MLDTAFVCQCAVFRRADCEAAAGWPFSSPLIYQAAPGQPAPGPTLSDGKSSCSRLVSAIRGGGIPGCVQKEGFARFSRIPEPSAHRDFSVHEEKLRFAYGRRLHRDPEVY